MKKRLLSLALCLAMLLPTLLLFTSCQEEEVEATGTIAPMTVVIALMTDEKTNDAGVEAAEKALNRITENNFNTHVELKLFTEAEYYTKVEEALVARRQAIINGDKSTSVGDVKDKIYDEEKNREVTAYPEVYENQIDIFFVGSYEKLVDYVLWKSDFATEEEYAADRVANSDPLVASLDGDMSVAPLLSKYLSSGLLNAGKVSIGGTAQQYAIPSNAIYSNGEYMLVDKAMFDKYSYSIEEVSDVIALEEYLTDIAKDYPEVTPLYNLGSMGFVSITGKNSVIAQKIDSSTSVTTSGVEPSFFADSTAFKNIINSVMSYASINSKYPVAGSDLSSAEAGKFAVGFVAANENEIEAYKENYYVIETNKSMVTTEQACSNMLAVSAFTSDTTRCMEIINLLQTNAKAHNILVYGDENVTYTVDESTKMIKRQYEGDAVYVMDIYKTGNLFITAQNTEMTETELMYSANDWALAKAASRHVFFGPYLGFKIEYAGEVAESGTAKPVANFDEISENAYNQLLADIFKFENYTINEAGEVVDAEGNPLTYKKDGKVQTTVTSFETYVEYLGQNIKSANGNQLGGQTVDYNGTIYNQFIAWRKLHFLTN